MYDTSLRPRPETIMCERAALMWRARGVMINYAGLCVDAPPQIDGAETDLVAKLTAESERVERLAEKAGRIVSMCDGCNSSGIRLRTAQCPYATVVQAREWWQEAVRTRSTS